MSITRITSTLWRFRRRLIGVSSMLLAGVLVAGNFFAPGNQPFGYLAGLAASSLVLSSGSELLYAPYFEQDSYGGDLMAIPVSAAGTPDYLNPTWRASQTLPTLNWNTGRNIVTTDGAGTAVPFGWDTLTPLQRGVLDPVTASDPTKVARTASPILNFLRGDRSQEAKNGGTLRDRTSLLGDIIHTTPRYVARPDGAHLFDDYPAFAAANTARAPRVYAAANDGMLHAFDALTGIELFAYVPSILIEKMPRLTQRPYLHEYMADGPITVRDAYYGGDWHTVLVGGLGAGGQGFYALDVTSAEDAASTTETVAAAKVLWEYDHDDDANLGFTYGRPSIVRLESSGAWVALVPNGYVNSASDGRVGDGAARLIAIDIATGAKVGEIAVAVASDSPGDPNGLSSPSAIDIDGNGRVDTVFAGDIKGNLWRFDISADPSGWAATDATLLFTATNGAAPQSITTAPEVTRHPADADHTGLDLLVLVGTGRLLDSDDYNPLLVTTDSIYGLWVQETMSGPVDTSALLVQTLSEASHSNGTRTRVASNNTINWSIHSGWVLNLPQGERLLGDPQLRRQRLQMTTTNPTIPSGENWYLSLSYKTGGAPASVVIDIDGDAKLTAGDNVDGNDDGDTSDPEDRVVGQYQQFGLASQPLLVLLDGFRGSALINHLNALSPAEILPDASDSSGPALRGGHFDLDVSSQIYPLGSGSTDHHKHEWDDKSGLTYIDYLEIPRCNADVTSCLENPDLYVNDPAFTDLDEQITDPTQRFQITVLNSALSPGGVIEINGSSVPVTVYEELVRRHVNGGEQLPVYQLGPNPPAGVQQLTSFKMSFSANTILQGGLIGSATGCVRGNEPGALGEYRNGALTVQVVDATTGTMAPVLHYATSGLLWESTAFWHWHNGCYGTEQWAESYQNCVIEGNICDCLDDNDSPGLCRGDPDSDPVLIDDGGGTDTSSGGATGCTVTALNPNPRSWMIEMEQSFCETTVVPPTELKLEFDRTVKHDQVTTLTAYYGTSSQSISFAPTQLFSSRVGSPLQFDLTEIEFKDSQVNKIKIRNMSTAEIIIDRIEVSWSGGDALQKLKKIRRERPTGTDYTSSLPAVSPASVSMGMGIGTSLGGPACLYTLAIDYTLPSGGTASSTHTFDQTLSGIGGYPLEIDMDEAFLEDGLKVRGVRIRSLLDDPVTITGVTLSWSGSTADQKLKKIRDETDSGFDVVGAGTSPVSKSGLAIDVGGEVSVGDACAEAVAEGDGTGIDGTGGTGSGSGSGDGSTAGSSGGTAVDGGPGSVVGAVSGFNISNTTTLGGMRQGRLLWREIVR